MSLQQLDYSKGGGGGGPMSLGCLAAVCSRAGSLMTPSAMASLVLTGHAVWGCKVNWD